MAEEDALDYDVSVNVHKGSDGYGIYFTQKEGIIRVTKLDTGSEAERSGVRVNDVLVSVKDLDNLLPAEAPGMRIDVNPQNYQAALNLVRSMKYCELRFKAPGFDD